MEDKSQLYVAYFDTLGFECVINLTKHEKKAIWNVLADKPVDRLPIFAMIMRAKANPQRFPEIYTFWSEIDQETLARYAADTPQALADLIREKGEPVFVTPRQKEVIK